MKTNDRKKGISLIVLIITILVMIIIAAAIILNIDDTKIINNANKATTNNNVAAAREVRVVARAEWRVNEDKLRDDGYNSFKAYLEHKLEEAEISGVYVTKNGRLNITYTDINDDSALIPDGFSVSTVAGEQTVENGLVVVDNLGNEFVWIPVDNINLFKRTTTYTGTITDPGSAYTEPYNKTTDGVTLSATNDLTGEYKEYEAMYNSVAKYGGFYIARYEAGKEGTDTLVSKKGVTVYDNVQWGTSFSSIGTNGAVYLSRQMYKDSESVVSTLCYGVQWDSALQFIATRGKKDVEYIEDASAKGNYSSVAKTGSNPNYAVNNIYDMAGNRWEWTMEGAWASGKRVVRGHSKNGVKSAAVRGSNDANLNSGYSFRVALYIK